MVTLNPDGSEAGDPGPALAGGSDYRHPPYYAGGVLRTREETQAIAEDFLRKNKLVMIKPKTPPKVFVLWPDGQQFEVMLQEVSESANADQGSFVTMIFKGRIDTERPLRTSEIHGFSQDGTNVGGVPPTVVMTCPWCNHHDEGHECPTFGEEIAQY